MRDLLGELRGDGDYATGAPIVVLANKGSESAALSAIDVGADDFIVKPMRATELAARLEFAMTRARHAEAPSRAKALRAGPIFLNADRRETYIRLDNGEIRPLNLTKREFALDARDDGAQEHHDDAPTVGRGSVRREHQGQPEQSGRLHSPVCARKSNPIRAIRAIS